MNDILLILILAPLVLFAYELFRRIKEDKEELPSYSKDLNESLLRSGLDIEHGMSIGENHTVVAGHQKSIYYQPN